MTLETAGSAERATHAIAAALVEGALPGELDGFDEAARASAAALVAAAALVRQPGEPTFALGPLPGVGTRRRMRLAICNDDMPFLVDSIAAAFSARGIDIHRLLHPVCAVRRDADGRLLELLPAETSGARRESLIYLELDRTDARVRRQLEGELRSVLRDVRQAVEDWPRMQLALRAAAERLPDGEGAALLRWFLERHFTLLGASVETRDGATSATLGIARDRAGGLLAPALRTAAFRWFDEGGEAPLLLTSDEVSTVHRRAPLDLLVVPVREGSAIVALAVQAGLWTSAALRAPSDRVPVLRARLRAIEERYGFDPGAHAGKALHHALSALPHDLLVALAPAALEEVALTAMSLADRPRPKLVLVPGPLGRRLFAFVWIPRDQFSTARRVAIRAMLEEAAAATTSAWALDLGEGDLALVRYTLELAPGAVPPDAAALDRQLETMLRGWAPAVEQALAAVVSPARAARLALAWAERFPAAYRMRTAAADAAADIVRLHALETPADRAVRLHLRSGDAPARLRLTTYRLGDLIPLSEAVPVFEHFGFRVLEEVPTPLDEGRAGYLHDFLLERASGEDAAALLDRASAIEEAIADVLAARAEDDPLNALVTEVGLAPRSVLLLRAWFRYLRQTGAPFALQSAAAALAANPAVTEALIGLFDARHGPAGAETADAADERLAAALTAVSAIEDDRILGHFASVVRAILRTNAFVPAAQEALAFKLESARIPFLPRPVPWREIWVYSPRVEGIHLRGGPIARGGLRWSDRRDDFRTEILGLMKAQIVKNAVIVPTGAKGGFYPKQLPPAARRDAWLAEGTESYRIFIRALLSITDTLVEDRVVHPSGVRVTDGDDPYFVVAADKGTATFSDVANGLAIDRGFWLGDAFASGGSHGYDHKAMAITARGAWISVQRHFAEMGVDVQQDPITVVGCGDMSGDVFGNGMLLSESLRLVAAFDHRHIFLDPAPDAEASWAERQRLFAMPRSSWADYDPALISAGGGVYPRSRKSIPLSPAMQAVLGIDAAELDPAALIAAILRAPVDLLWFGGIGTYVKATVEADVVVGDPANDAQRVTGRAVRARVIGEGANLGVTQAGRIEFALAGGRINTDFIDNSAGVDCSDNEVNIKIALNREVAEGRLDRAARDGLLQAMTDDVAAIVLEDNRLQTLGLSLAERGGAAALPAQLAVIDSMEAAGRIDRAVDGIEPGPALLRRAAEGQGLTRPELAVVLSHGKLALQQAIERSPVTRDPLFRPLLHAAFPTAMREAFGAAIDAHRLAPEIVATKMANRVVNRLGLVAPFELAEEEGASLAQVAAAYFAVDAVLELEPLFAAAETAPLGEAARLDLLAGAGEAARLHVANLMRAAPGDMAPGALAARLAPGVRRLEAGLEGLLRQEARASSAALAARLGADPVAVRVVRLFELDGAIGTAALAARTGGNELLLSQGYVRLGEALGLDWARAAALRFQAADAWEKQLVAGLVRDFEQLRLEFLARLAGGADPVGEVDRWLAEQAPRVAQFRRLIDRARQAALPTAAILAQLAAQARALLAR